jgi:hypothetical protein
MARPPYSKRLLGETVVAGTPFVSAPVPDGKLWIVNCLSYALTDGDFHYLFVYLPGPLYILDVNVTLDPAKGSFMTHQVMNAGETLTVQASHGTWSMLISGYELSVSP